MTRQSDFKRCVRARMAKTGESYTAARHQLIQAAHPQPRELPGLVPGYPGFGGAGPDISAVAHVLTQSGVVAPHSGLPLSEAMIFAMMGGPGFMYFVFEYKGVAPTMTIVARSFSLPDPLVDKALASLGVVATIKTTGSQKVAKKHLDEALDSGRAALLTVDTARLPWGGYPPDFSWGALPQLIAVAGKNDGCYWVDDVARVPLSLDEAALAACRKSYAKGKHRLVTVDAPPPNLDLETSVTAALRGIIRAHHEAPFKGYASNFGLKGLSKWASLLTQPRDKKGWPRLFSLGEAHARARLRTASCLERAYTPPAAGRALFAEFLEEAADLLAAGWLREIAARYEASAGIWGDLAERVKQGTSDDLEAAFEARRQADQAFHEGGMSAAAKRLAAYHQAEEAARSSEGGLADDPTLFEEMAAMVREIISWETEALAELDAKLG